MRVSLLDCTQHRLNILELLILVMCLMPVNSRCEGSGDLRIGDAWAT